ncbi:Integrase, catalytic region [Propionibacterium freudenreichii]|nr:Integrase, catalytic region [Propionibacterium freudenreichii]
MKKRWCNLGAALHGVMSDQENPHRHGSFNAREPMVLDSQQRANQLPCGPVSRGPIVPRPASRPAS